MGYLHIDNLYKNQEILMFKECYALEKIHGTSAHIKFSPSPKWKTIYFFSGGENHINFVNLFDENTLVKRFSEVFPQLDSESEVTFYGEAYGGSQQKMSHTYGKELKFIVFDVKVGTSWLAVPDAHQVSNDMGFDFVWYMKTPTDLDSLDLLRDSLSVQSDRNGIEEPKTQEGIVLRPPIEVTKNNGERIIAKHKSEKFQETKTPRKVIDPEKQKVLEEANAIADEWVTPMRLHHVLDKLPQDISMEGIPDVIKAMVEDVAREGKGEIVDSKEARKAIGKRAVQLFKQFLQDKLRGW